MNAPIKIPLPVDAPSVEEGGVIEEPSPSKSNWQSYLYILLFAMNCSLIVVFNSQPFVYLFVVLQGLFFVGLLELTHQSVHRNFVTNRRVNEFIGMFAASFVGFNLVGYRHFHLEHHRHTCDDDDPEGLLYIHSPSTRWSLLTAPIAHLWVAFSINNLAKRFVPVSKIAEWRRNRLYLVVMLGVGGLFVFADLSLFLKVYVVPLCLFAYMDSFFSQAEHYDALVRKTSEKVDVASVTFDIQVPLLLSHLMLNRNLHRVHHVWPRTRWFEAPARIEILNKGETERVMTLFEFVLKWFKQGPRLWVKAG